MGRLILIALVVVFLVWLARRALASNSSQKEQTPPSEGQGDLVSCAHCGVNLPKSEARSAGGRHYCSEEHWRLGPRER